MTLRDRPLGDVQEAVKNISSPASTDLFCKTFMNFSPFSVLWEEVRAHLATRAKNTQVADVIRGVLLTDAFKALEAAMQLPLDARDLRLAASAKVEAHRLFGYLGENASLFSLNAQSGTNVKDATTEVLVAFCTLVIRPLTDLAFQKANGTIEKARKFMIAFITNFHHNTASKRSYKVNASSPVVAKASHPCSNIRSMSHAAKDSLLPLENRGWRVVHDVLTCIRSLTSGHGKDSQSTEEY